ncbi:MAG: leucine-rich repeat protein [Clostridiales bacterium]|nr:leucine-rich repeat protein [Clostridiales bacterium]
MKRNKKFCVLLACVLCLLFALTGCGDGKDPNGEDTGTYYTVTFDSRGGSVVESQRVRAGNPVVRPNTPVKEGYFLRGWYTDEAAVAEEWHFDTDRAERNITLYAGWTANEDIAPTASLEYVKDGNAYTVTGVGEETIVVIPAEHEGLPVTAIQGHHGTGAFAQKAMTSVTIPDSVTTIGQNTFYGCSDLVTVSVGEGSRLAEIGNNAFSACSSLVSMYIPKGVTAVGDMAFNNCAALKKFSVAGDNAAYRSENGHLIESATQTLVRGVNNASVPSGVKILAQGAFRRANGITELNIPKTVTTIGNYFIQDSTIETINYAGTEDEWNAIEKSETMWNYGNRTVQLVFNAAVGQKILVAYFSCTNTTKSVAEAICDRVSGADIYRITPAVPYTSADLNYNTDCRANREQNDPSARPEISGSVENISQYGIIFIGYPIWWGQAPKIIYTFFESYDYEFEGVTIIPFCTSGSSGIGSSATNLHATAPKANWKEGARISGNNVGALIAQMN